MKTKDGQEIDWEPVKPAAERLLWMYNDLCFKPPEVGPLHLDEAAACVSTIAKSLKLIPPSLPVDVARAAYEAGTKAGQSDYPLSFDSWWEKRTREPQPAGGTQMAGEAATSVEARLARVEADNAGLKQALESKRAELHAANEKIDQLEQTVDQMQAEIDDCIANDVAEQPTPMDGVRNYQHEPDGES